MSQLKLLRAVLLVAGCALVTGIATAQTRAALTKNVDEPGRIPYQNVYNFSGSDTACSGSVCSLPFPAVPAGKRLVVESVSILLASAGTAPPMLLAFGDGTTFNTGNIALVNATWTDTNNTILGSHFWVMDKLVRVYYEPGTTPKVKLIAGGNVTLPSNASVIGYLIDATN